ncbi:MAG: class I SAM-dependent methyltransferase [Paracoccaceae bacterium]
MGIDLHLGRAILNVRPHIAAKAPKSLMLGRQTLRLHKPRKTRKFNKAVAKAGYDFQLEDIAGSNHYAEGFFEKIGLPDIDSMDNSDYENCTIVHDLNKNVPKKLHNTYDFILDGGTIEHVFDVPKAFENVHKMLKKGGVFLSFNGGNGWFGHGFYQFSPEIVWRHWGDFRGYEVLSCDAVSTAPDAWPVAIPDPKSKGRRAQVILPGRYYLGFAVRKMGEQSKGLVQQSDYSRRWKEVT